MTMVSPAESRGPVENRLRKPLHRKRRISMSIGHKHRHTGRRPRRSYRSRFRAERHLRQRGPRDEHRPYGPGHDGWRHDVPRDGGWLFGNDAFDECGIVRSLNTVMSDFLADAEALLAARLERVSLDDIARQAQPNPLHPQHGAHHHG